MSHSIPLLALVSHWVAQLLRTFPEGLCPSCLPAAQGLGLLLGRLWGSVTVP